MPNKWIQKLSWTSLPSTEHRTYKFEEVILTFEVITGMNKLQCSYPVLHLRIFHHRLDGFPAICIAVDPYRREWIIINSNKPKVSLSSDCESTCRRIEVTLDDSIAATTIDTATRRTGGWRINWRCRWPWLFRTRSWRWAWTGYPLLRILHDDLKQLELDCYRELIRINTSMSSPSSSQSPKLESSCKSSSGEESLSMGSPETPFP